MNNIKPSDFYNYFRECYKLDYKEFIVENLLSTKYKFKWFAPKKEELLNEHMPIIPYNNPKVKELETEIELYKLEKKLLYGCFFILGESENHLIKDKRVCSPLILFPATVVSKDNFQYLKIEKESLIVNRGVLSKLELSNEKLNKDAFIDELSNGLSATDDNAVWLRNLLNKYFCNVDSEELSTYPNLWSGPQIRAYFTKNKNKQERLKIIPAAGTVFVDKALSSLRVLEDLESMASKNDFNDSIKELLNKSGDKSQPEFSLLKNRLNTEQYHALQNANKYTNSIIVGPPGTGKSYTISSIVADTVLQGKSVLVVSKTKPAVEVIRNMLETDFNLKNFIIHTTGTHYKTSLKAKLRKYLSGIQSRNRDYPNKIKIDALYNKLEETEKKLQNFISKELALDHLEFKDDLSFSEMFQKFFMKVGYKLADEIWNLFFLIDSYTKQLESKIKTYVKYSVENNIKENSKKYRNDLPYITTV